MTLDFQPARDDQTKQFTNILQLTTGDNSPTYGYRNPLISFHPTHGLHFCLAINGNPSACHNSGGVRPCYDKWTTVEVSQELVDCKYMYKIMIGDKKLISRRNHKPEEFADVKVFASNPWDTAQPGFIKDFKVQSKKGE